MDGSAVKEIADLSRAAEARLVTEEGTERVFSTRPLHTLPLPERRREESVDVIQLSTLHGLVDYLGIQRDGLDPETHFVHVVSPTAVRIVGSLLGQGETNQRHEYLAAKVSTDPFPFGRDTPREEAQILLQTRFRRTEDLDRAIRIIGNLATEEGVTQEDDGMTQRVAARMGVARLSQVSVENPFMLAPFRTFPEVEAPDSPFVIRLSKHGHEVAVRIIEADGGAWKIEAVLRIREWIEAKGTGFRVVS